MSACLAALHDRPVNFVDPAETMTVANGWTVDGATIALGSEPEGPPAADGPFLRARRAIVNFDFSDPSIVVGLFDPAAPLVGRNMLVEIKALGLHYLCGVRVTQVREDEDNGTSYFGYRFDTLVGHIESGFEWFLLVKDHQTGALEFRIEAHWKPGDFPNWWSRVGFFTVGHHFRRVWRHRAAARLRRLAYPPDARLIEAPGDAGTPRRTSPQRADATARP
jgi:uncharacterized protein (UPF0548 family)